MSMVYFKNPNSGKVHGYDTSSQASLIAIAKSSGWADVTSSWPPPPPAPTLTQQAASAIQAGLPITSTADGALGTFELTQTTQLRFASLLQYYDKFGTFPNKSPTITVTDIDGKPHTLSAAQFEGLYQTLGDYLTLLEDCVAGIVTQLPSASNFGTIP
jgi:hypothetical protein